VCILHQGTGTQTAFHETRGFHGRLSWAAQAHFLYNDIGHYNFNVSLAFFIFFPHIWAYSALGSFSDYIINNKTPFFKNTRKHFLKQRFVLKKKFDFHTEQGFRKM